MAIITYTLAAPGHWGLLSSSIHCLFILTCVGCVFRSLLKNVHSSQNIQSVWIKTCHLLEVRQLLSSFSNCLLRFTGYANKMANYLQPSIQNDNVIVSFAFQCWFSSCCFAVRLHFPPFLQRSCEHKSHLCS